MKNKLIKKVTKVIVATMLSTDPYEWPPSCMFFSYQPSRPEKLITPSSNANAYDNKNENTSN